MLLVVMSRHDRPLNPEGPAAPDPDDASLPDRATAVLATDLRSAEIDRSYGIYDTLPLDTRDEWGNLADFLGAVGPA